MSLHPKNLRAYFKATSDNLISSFLLEKKSFHEGLPVLLKKGKGAWIWDEQKNIYLDFYLSGGKVILGHADWELGQLVRKQVKKSVYQGYPNRWESELAFEILRYISMADKIAFFTSRASAILAAINLSHTLTEREYIVTFAGCQKVLLPFPVIELPLDSEQVLEDYFAKNGEKTALVIIEALPSGAGILPQRPEFFQYLRKLTLKYGTLLLFDESITAFRGEAACLSSSLHIDWDFLILGESIGSSFPFTALLGKKENFAKLDNFALWSKESPGQVSLLAAIHTIKRLVEGKENQNIVNLSAELEKKFEKVIFPIFKESSLKLYLQVWPGIFSLRFDNKNHFTEPRTLEQIFPENNRWYSFLQRQLLKKGIYLPHSPEQPAFLSVAHQEKELQFFMDSLQKVATKIVQKVEKGKSSP